MRPYKTILLLTIVLATAGCASTDRVRGNILQPTDRMLPDVQDNLVIMDVRIATDGDPLKLNEMLLRHTGTGEPWRVALFSNVLMKTQALPFEERDDGIHHTIALDLPAGTYQVQTLEFRNFIVNLAGTNVAQSLEHTLAEPLLFTVVTSANPQYVGRLELDVRPYVTGEFRDATSTVLDAAHEKRRPSDEFSMNTGGTDAVLGAAAAATATDIQTMSGSVQVSVTPPDEKTTADAGKQFRALSRASVVQGRMWVGAKPGS